MAALPASTLAELLHDGLAAGKLPYVTVTSNSMAPLLQAGDQVGVAAVSPANLRPGDIIIVETAADLLTHRYWQPLNENGQPHLLLRGDRLLAFDSPSPNSCLIGRIVTRRRGQRQLDLESGPGNWLNRRLMGIIRLEMTLLTGNSRPNDYQTHLPRLRTANGRPHLRVRLLRRLLRIWAELLTAAVTFLARSTTKA
jgi:signal peptidase I